jgi:hypothetical protein
VVNAVVSVEVSMLKVMAAAGLLASSWSDTVTEATLPASSFVLAAKVTVRTVAVEAAVQVGVRSAPSLVQRTVGACASTNIAALAVMVTVPPAGTSVVGVNQITAFPPAVDSLILSILAAPPHVTDPGELIGAGAAVAEAAASAVTTGLPVPAFTSAAVGAVAPFAYTAHRTFSVIALVNVMSSTVPPTAVPVDAGCKVKPAVY